MCRITSRILRVGRFYSYALEPSLIIIFAFSRKAYEDFDCVISTHVNNAQTRRRWALENVNNEHSYTCTHLYNCTRRCLLDKTDDATRGQLTAEMVIANKVTDGMRNGLMVLTSFIFVKFGCRQQQ